jgi:hypothetical protein
LAGASATATAAAWANRLLDPMTNVSNWFRLGRAADRSDRSRFEVVHRVRIVDHCLGGRLGRAGFGLDGDRDAYVASQLAGERRDYQWPQPGVEHIAGEVVGGGEDDGVLHECERLGQPQPGSLLR